MIPNRDLTVDVLAALGQYDLDLAVMARATKTAQLTFPKASFYIERAVEEMVMEKIRAIRDPQDKQAEELVDALGEQYVPLTFKFNDLKPGAVDVMLMAYAFNLSALGSYGHSPMRAYAETVERLWEARDEVAANSV